ncbi:MAG: ABC transporter permease [Polyangiaceae bacterium]|nr:ABC transporter permease [Polyangiaceae bacterium]
MTPAPLFLGEPSGGAPPGPLDPYWLLVMAELREWPVPTAAVLAVPWILFVGWLGLELCWLRARSLRRLVLYKAEVLGWAGLTGLGMWALAPVALKSLGAYAAAVALLTFALLVLRSATVFMLRTPRRRRILLRVAVALSVVACGVLWWVVGLLPEARASYFVSWHQVVRVAAALSLGLSVLLVGLLLLPLALDRIEKGGFVSFVAVRHVRAAQSGYLTVISVLAIIGVGLASFALCGVIAIMTGFGEDLKGKILGNNAHVRIETNDVGGFDLWRDTLDRVRATTGVVAATPVAAGEAMASSRTNTAGVMLRGVELESIGTVIDLLENIEVGRVEYLTDTKRLADLPPEEVIWVTPGGQRYLRGRPSRIRPTSGDRAVDQAVVLPDEYPGIVLGRELAKSLHAYVGDEITLVGALGDLGPMGVMPRTRRFRVAAVFYSGMYEYDAAYAYVTIEQAQDFLDLEARVTDIDARVEDAESVGPVRDRVELAVARPDLRVRDWKEMNRQLFSALKLEKLATFVFLSIAILVASFCIICTLLLMVTEKSKEIAILKSLGASDRSILWTFMTEGVVIGAIGTIFGVAFGAAITLGLKYVGVRLDPEVYYIDRLPINVSAIDFTWVAVSAFLITTIATIYPALAASRLRPVDGIRYE